MDFEINKSEKNNSLEQCFIEGENLENNFQFIDAIESYKSGLLIAINEQSNQKVTSNSCDVGEMLEKAQNLLQPSSEIRHKEIIGMKPALKILKECMSWPLLYPNIYEGNREWVKGILLFGVCFHFIIFAAYHFSAV